MPERTTPEIVRQMLGTAISLRLAEGWYPSHQTDEGHEHDRHVMIWVRQYEHWLTVLADELETVTVEREAVIDELHKVEAERDRARAGIDFYDDQAKALLVELADARAEITTLKWFAAE